MSHLNCPRGPRRRTLTEGAHKAENNTQDKDSEAMKEGQITIGTEADHTETTAEIDREIGEDNKETTPQVGGLHPEDIRPNVACQHSPGATDLDQRREADKNTKYNHIGPIPQTHPSTNQSC